MGSIPISGSMTLTEAQQAWDELKHRLEADGFQFVLHYTTGEPGYYNPGVRLELCCTEGNVRGSTTLIPELTLPTTESRVDEDPQETKPTPAQTAAQVLNDALTLDPDAIMGLVQSYVLTNNALADHPTIQVHQETETAPTKLRLVGLLNGILLTLNPEEVLVYFLNEDTNQVIHFTTKPYDDFVRTSLPRG